MSTEQRVRAAVRDLVDGVPVVTPAAGQVRSRAERRSAPGGSRWAAPALAAVAVLAVLAGAAVAPSWLARSAPASGDLSGEPGVLPAEFPGVSWRTASVADAPPGPAIAIYSLTSVTQPAPGELVVIGVDGRTHRVVDGDMHAALTDHGSQAPLLSPDGTRIAGAGGQLLDLTTGQLTRHAAPDGAPAAETTTGPALAWSADSRRVAYELAPDQVPRPPGSGRHGAGLALLDTATGAMDIVDTDAVGDQRVAFSPDGSEIAVWAGDGGEAAVTEIAIVDSAGELSRVLELPPGHELTAGGTAWSPDGARLALLDIEPDRVYPAFVEPTRSGPVEPVRGSRSAVGSRRTSAGSPRPPDCICTTPSGRRRRRCTWSLRSPGALPPADDARVLAETRPHVHGGEPTAARGPLGELPVGDHDRVEHLHLATGLLATAKIRDNLGWARHGPLPEPYRSVLTGAVAVLLLAEGSLVMMVRARRKDPAASAAPAGDGDVSRR